MCVCGGGGEPTTTCNCTPLVEKPHVRGTIHNISRSLPSTHPSSRSLVTQPPPPAAHHEAARRLCAGRRGTDLVVQVGPHVALLLFGALAEIALHQVEELVVVRLSHAWVAHLRI